MDQDNHDQTPGEIDLDKILLPNKEVHSPDSAQRVEAGELLAQEQSATLVPPTAPAPPQPTRITPVRTEGVSPLQTYQSDISRVVEDSGASVVSIAAAEATRRSGQSLEQVGSKEPARPWRTTLFVGVGVVLLAAAVGSIAYVMFANAPLPAQQQISAPLISVDHTTPLVLSAGANANSAMAALTSAKNSVAVSLGLIERIYVGYASTSPSAAPVALDASGLLSLIAPGTPQELLRDLPGTYVLGVHSFGVNQPFLIMRVDSYEQAYASMLAWEQTMHRDLSPLFSYTPAPAPHPVQSDASSTPPAVLNESLFVDKVVANHDARVLLDQYGSIYFLWTFLDRGTLLVTTNEATVREVISRLTNAPVTALPGSQ